MFWNARGLADEVQQTLEFMTSRNVAAALFCETNVYDANLSQGRWKWLRASQLLPHPGDTSPRRGMGAFINKDILPGASVVKVYDDSFWVNIPGPSKKLDLPVHDPPSVVC